MADWTARTSVTGEPPDSTGFAVLPLAGMFGVGRTKGEPLWREVSAGADVSAHGWLLYSGVTVSPWSDLWSDGVRLRVGTGVGAYRYAGDRWREQGTSRLSFSGRVAYFDGLAGYLWRLGPLTAKTFAGVAMIDHEIRPDDYLASSGARVGAKGVVELWLNIGARSWASLDASYTSAHRTLSARTRVGYRVLPSLALGVEAGVDGSSGAEETIDNGVNTVTSTMQYDARLGGFARLEWFGGELSLSGGLSSDIGRRNEPYGTVGYLYQF